MTLLINKTVPFSLFFLLLNGTLAFCQNTSSYLNFTPSYTIPVYRTDNSPLKMPWTGSLNNPQFSETDINFDGKKDLFVFERSENRVLIFLNTAEKQNEIAYTYAAEYSSSFPKMHEWALLRDYNNDGKEDIFTSSIAGIAVYKNTSSAQQVSFEKVTDLIRVHKKEYSTNLFVSSQDIPAIVDIDKDGDLDILTFYILGKYLTAYQNMSNELGYPADSLHYVVADYCWGDFAEGNSATDLYLDEECPFTVNNKIPPSKTLHTGSTVSTFDLDNDQDEDLLLGDIDSREIVALYNNTNGFNNTLYFSDTLFPNNYPISITSMPAVFFADINNDGKKDMIAAPNDNLISNHHQGVWAYLNETDQAPSRFSLQEKGFLQNDMIDLGTHTNPLFYDLNQDGLTDIIAGSYGLYVSSIDTMQTIFSEYTARLFYFENTGTVHQPEFTLKDDDLFNLSEHKLHSITPTFGDINNDGKDELILGQQNGQLLLLENQSTTPSEPDFVVSEQYYSEIDAGYNSTPTIIDLNKDQLQDLVIGNKDGFLFYYENIGTPTAAIFSPVPTVDQLGSVNVIDSNLSYYGYCYPAFFQHKEELLLFCGSTNGSLHTYKTNTDALSGYEHLSNNYLKLTEIPISQSAPSLADLNADGFPEMIVGSRGGGLLFFQGTPPYPEAVFNQVLHQIKLYPNPADNFFTIEPNNQIKEVRLYNQQGVAIHHYSRAAQYNTQGIPPGVYLLQILFNNGHVGFQKLSIL